MQKFNFNYVDPNDIKPTKNLKDGETIKYIDGKPYLCWHDLIDIQVPLFNDPSLLLTKRVIKPLYGVAPRNILGQIDKYWWERTRKRVYESSDSHCRCCGIHKSKQIGYPKNIDAHEVYDTNYETGEVRLKCIVPLCASGCHQYIHFGRLFAQHEAGKINDKQFYSVISHGNTILKEAGLPQKDLDPGINDNIYDIPFEQWHLILNIEGKEQKFYSLYKNELELDAAYGKMSPLLFTVL